MRTLHRAFSGYRALSAATRAPHGSCPIEPLERRTLMSAWAVDDMPMMNGASVNSMAADRDGNVYAGGYAVASDGTTDLPMIREKAQGSWSTVYLDSASGGIEAIAVDAVGDVFAAGITSGSPSPSRFLLERHAGQSAFSPIDAPAPGDFNGLTVDAAGNVFAVGSEAMTTNRTTTYDWVVRERAAGASAFVELDRVKGADAKSICTIDSGPAAGIYVVGKYSNDQHWTVRKSSDGGRTWSQVDQFQYDPNGIARSNPQGIASDPNGNVYVVGNAQATTITGYTKVRGKLQPVYGNSYDHWIVRKSGDGGATWSVDNDYQMAASKSSSALGAGTDLAGNLYVVGTAIDAGGVNHAVVRTNAGRWQTIDDEPATAGSARYMSFTADAGGTLYAGGFQGYVGWVVRSAPGPAAPAAIVTSSSLQVTDSLATSGLQPSDLDQPSLAKEILG
jgi:hypothetical protein